MQEALFAEVEVEEVLHRQVEVPHRQAQVPHKQEVLLPELLLSKLPLLVWSLVAGLARCSPHCSHGSSLLPKRTENKIDILMENNLDDMEAC